MKFNFYLENVILTLKCSLAEFHATKTGHVDFSESTEEIAPLTEEEKKAKLEELRRKLAEKRSGTSEQDKLDKKKNEARHRWICTA